MIYSSFCLLGSSGIDISHGIIEEVPCECSPDHTVVLTAVSFHQHVGFQQSGDITYQSTSTAAPQYMLLHQSMGSKAEVKTGTAGSMGRTSGIGTCCRLSSDSNYTSHTSFAGTTIALTLIVLVSWCSQTNWYRHFEYEITLTAETWNQDFTVIWWCMGFCYSTWWYVGIGIWYLVWVSC